MRLTLRRLTFSTANIRNAPRTQAFTCCARNRWPLRKRIAKR